jgi:hypothetical protein
MAWPASDVGWGQLDAATISQIFRVYDALLDLEFRTPYLAGVQSSNVASHIVRSMVQAATGNAMTGALGTPSDKIVILTASNTNVTGIAGLFHLDWLVGGYQRDVAASAAPWSSSSANPRGPASSSSAPSISPRQWTSFATALH